MKPLAMLALILLMGCAAKKKQAIQYVTPDCVRLKLSHECPLLPNGKLDTKCPVNYDILCVKVKENK